MNLTRELSNFKANLPFSPKLSLGQNSEVMLMEKLICFLNVFFDLMKVVFDDPCDGFCY
ncbi:MAG: hypothetical protein ACJAW3_001515 [Lentimonas sp.]|jgi:hypothetical protein